MELTDSMLQASPLHIASAMMRFDIPVAQIVQILHDSEPEGELPLSRAGLAKEFTKYSMIDTPYGRVTKE